MDRSRKRNPILWITISVISLFVITTGVVVGQSLESSEYVSAASLIGAVGSIVAAALLLGTMILQSWQLKDQAVQFTDSSRLMHLDAERNALLLVKTIMDDAHERIVALNPAAEDLSELSLAWSDVSSISRMVSSADPKDILDAGKLWLKFEYPSMEFFVAIRTATTLYYDAKTPGTLKQVPDPVLFYLANEEHIAQVPFVQVHTGVATLMARLMYGFGKARKSAFVALQCAQFLTTPANLVRPEKIAEAIQGLKDEGIDPPPIATIVSSRL